MSTTVLCRTKRLAGYLTKLGTAGKISAVLSHRMCEGDRGARRRDVANLTLDVPQQ